MNRKKIVASTQLFLLIVSLFAFSHLIYLSNQPLEAAAQDVYSVNSPSVFEVVALQFLSKLRAPLFPRVSAQVPELGCCSKTSDDSVCAVSTRENCKGDFFLQSQCKDVSVCQKGCCYNDEVGDYAPNVLKRSCSSPNKWDSDATCQSVPGSRLGCCFLNEKTSMVSERQCEVATKNVIGERAPVKWDPKLSLLQCRLVFAEEVLGACVTEGNACVFNTQQQCATLKGSFNRGVLCTSPALNTSCTQTTQTTCHDQRVHFIDSCGNRANVYDASRAKDPSYWEKVVAPEDSCHANHQRGNADSKSCGNCNPFTGGICASAAPDNVKPTYGANYCKPSFCTFKGQTYRNGESWCVYDGAIGNGDDVVGSRHWKYVCSQGAVQIEPCSDGRQEICTQKNTPLAGKSDPFKEASCVKNNWRACLALNNAEGEKEQQEQIEACATTLHCRVEKVDIADKFDFEVCTPKYPAGSDLKQADAQNNQANTCALATQTCTVVRKQKLFGGCSYVANRDCLEPEFGQKMNDMCRKLGDCGGEVNIAGVYTKNHKITGSPKLSDSWIANLIGLAKPVPGLYAEREEYEDIEAILGVWDPGNLKDSLSSDITNTVSGFSLALGGVGTVLGFIGTDSLFIADGISLGPAAGPLIGAAAGAYVGLLLAEELGLSPAGTILMATGSATLGASVGGLLATGKSASTTFLIPIWGWIIFAVILIITSLFFFGSNCEPIEVSFECKPWQPPTGGDACESCNADPLKPCSKYRCESLGAACTFVNDFEKNGLCIHSDPDDVTPPTIRPDEGVKSKEIAYTKISDQGFTIASTSADCIDPLPITFGITTNEATKCRLSPNATATFDDMQNFGPDTYSLNHSVRLPIPDPSHGQARGANWTGNLELFVACQDVHGNQNKGPYTISMCVKQGPDNTPTTIEGVQPKQNTIISTQKTTQDVTLQTYELATCNWDVVDTTYAEMKNEFFCNDTLFHPSTPQGYGCSTTLPITNATNRFYVRCSDQPWLANTAQAEKRNENAESFVYTLNRPESKIVIDSVTPNTVMHIKSPLALFDVEVKTSGGGQYHVCKYSVKGFGAVVEMFDTLSSRTHRQPNVQAKPGAYNLYVECVDETNDVARMQTSFEIIRDTSEPVISRIIHKSGSINFETTERAQCRYDTSSCDFAWSDAKSTGSSTSHSITTKHGKTYFIRCEDGFGNKPVGCTTAIKAV